MIIEYLRPETLDEAINLLSRDWPLTYPLGGGTVLNLPNDEPFAVVDLQSLDLNRIEKKDDLIRIGATVTLQDLWSHDHIYPALKDAIRHSANFNIRQMATIAGSLITGEGHSPFVTVMLALDAQIEFNSNKARVGLGDFLPFRRLEVKGKLITTITFSTNIRVSYHYVARTPADFPIVCASVGKWPSGRTRVALGGFGSSPLLVFDGPNDVGADIAARDAYREAGDAWASASFRSDCAAILVNRCLKQIKS